MGLYETVYHHAGYAREGGLGLEYADEFKSVAAPALEIGYAAQEWTATRVGNMSQDAVGIHIGLDEIHAVVRQTVVPMVV